MRVNALHVQSQLHLLFNAFYECIHLVLVLNEYQESHFVHDVPAAVEAEDEEEIRRSKIKIREEWSLQGKRRWLSSLSSLFAATVCETNELVWKDAAAQAAGSMRRP